MKWLLGIILIAAVVMVGMVYFFGGLPGFSPDPYGVSPENPLGTLERIEARFTDKKTKEKEVVDLGNGVKKHIYNFSHDSSFSQVLIVIVDSGSKVRSVGVTLLMPDMTGLYRGPTANFMVPYWKARSGSGSPDFQTVRLGTGLDKTTKDVGKFQLQGIEGVWEKYSDMPYEQVMIYSTELNLPKPFEPEKKEEQIPQPVVETPKTPDPQVKAAGEPLKEIAAPEKKTSTAETAIPVKKEAEKTEEPVKKEVEQPKEIAVPKEPIKDKLDLKTEEYQKKISDCKDALEDAKKQRDQAKSDYDEASANYAQAKETSKKNAKEAAKDSKGKKVKTTDYALDTAKANMDSKKKVYDSCNAKMEKISGDIQNYNMLISELKEKGHH